LADRVFLTGGTGFIGRHLVEALIARGDQVRCLVRHTSDTKNLEETGVELIYGDITDSSTYQDVVPHSNVVYHLAGAVQASRPDLFTSVNEIGTRELIAACARADQPPVVVYVSSIAAGGPGSCTRPLKEADPPAPVSYYGRSKLAGEFAARSLAGKVPVSIVRPPIVFGEYDRDVLRLFQFAARGWYPVAGWRPRCYSLIHAIDLAQALIQTADRGERLPGVTSSAPDGQGVYYATEKQAPESKVLGSMLAEALGRNTLRIIRVPSIFLYGIGAVFEAGARMGGSASILNLDKAREVRAGSWICSGTKMAEQLGFIPECGLDQRLAQTAKWYQQQGWI
jgi:dihydroflavonol-4-reductase